MVVKSDGRRQPFDAKKIERGLKRALEKRPIPAVTIEKLLNEIEDEAAILGKASHEIPTEKIGDMLLKKLYDIDRVAYIRFASVYKKFNDLAEFIKEIEDIED